MTTGQWLAFQVCCVFAGESGPSHQARSDSLPLPHPALQQGGRDDRGDGALRVSPTCSVALYYSEWPKAKYYSEWPTAKYYMTNSKVLYDQQQSITMNNQQQSITINNQQQSITINNQQQSITMNNQQQSITMPNNKVSQCIFDFKIHCDDC